MIDEDEFYRTVQKIRREECLELAPSLRPMIEAVLDHRDNAEALQRLAATAERSSCEERYAAANACSHPPEFREYMDCGLCGKGCPDE